jgi:hypothetical protein
MDPSGDRVAILNHMACAWPASIKTSSIVIIRIILGYLFVFFTPIERKQNWEDLQTTKFKRFGNSTIISK